MIDRQTAPKVRFRKPLGVLGLALLLLALPLSASALKVVKEQTVTGFKFPESVAYDAAEKVLYVGNFGSELKPMEKDGAGYISKVSLTGQMLEEHFLPAAGVKMDKPKGIWVVGNRLWVTDIDKLWVFDTHTKQGRSVALPGIQFANDPAVMGKTAYVTDNRGDALYSVTPADFLTLNVEPKVKVEFSGKNVNPNGIYPLKNGTLALVGFMSDKEARAIFTVKPGGQPKALSKAIGRLDGVAELGDGTLLVTDWDSGSLFVWAKGNKMTTLATGFKGPADFAAFAHDGGTMVVVPDLVKSEVRMIQLGK